MPKVCNMEMFSSHRGADHDLGAHGQRPLVNVEGGGVQERTADLLAAAAEAEHAPRYVLQIVCEILAAHARPSQLVDLGRPQQVGRGLFQQTDLDQQNPGFPIVPVGNGGLMHLRENLPCAQDGTGHQLGKVAGGSTSPFCPSA